MKSWHLALVFSLLAGNAVSQATAAEKPMELIQSAKRIVFLGDSITYSGQYVAMFEAWLETQPLDPQPTIIDVGLPSETVSELSEEGHAGGAFPRPGVAERLVRVLDTTKADLLFVCYGMNCGIYEEFAEERFQKYRDGMLALRKEALGRGIKIVHITPPMYDDAVKPLAWSYNHVLDEYSRWLLDRRADGWTVIDSHFPMNQFVTEKKKSDPKFTVCPDAVHPNNAGHWLIARELIRWAGDEASANADSPEAMLKLCGAPEGLAELVQQRMAVLRDAYLSAAGHKRPGMRAGLPIPEATKRAAELTSQIEKLKSAK